MPSADGRNALLQSIQKGAKLKKTVTVDKSAPVIQGKVAASSVSAGGPVAPASAGSGDSNGAGPKLGGIFGGLSSMPKLKPVGSRGAQSTATATTTTSNKSPSPENTVKSNNRIGGGGGGAVDFADELAAKLTLKKQKHSNNNNNNNHSNSSISNNTNNNNSSNQVPVTESNLRTNRGPPPQPPVQLKNANDSSATPLGKSSYSSQKSQAPSTPSPSASNGPASAVTSPAGSIHSSVLPNKSTLFGGGGGGGGGGSSGNSSASGSPVPPPPVPQTVKPVPNYGKPNLAPKPPGMQLNTSLGSSSGGSSNGPNRNMVGRHHSMRSPRSPPVAPSGPNFPANHFGTLRGPPSSFQSSESIARYNNPIGRPAAPPPKPPVMKPPPPPPVRSVSNTNLSHLPLSLAPEAPEPNFGSANNVASAVADELKSKLVNSGSANNVATLTPTTSSNSIVSASQLSIGSTKTLSSGSIKSTAAPPLPPHRTCPAPPPPQLNTSTNSTGSVEAPPQPPQRISSIRQQQLQQLQQQQQQQQSLSNANSPSSTISSSQQSSNLQRKETVLGMSTERRKMPPMQEIDLESKYSFYFHKVTEFPAPIPFLNVAKSFPSVMRQQQQAHQQQQQ